MANGGERERAGTVLQIIARSLLLVVLVYAPWAYGSTRYWTIELLNAGCFVCFGLHVAALLLKGRRPCWPRLPLVCLGLLLAETAWMAFNAHSYRDLDFQEFVPRVAPFPALPGSWDFPSTLFYLERQFALAGAFLVAADMTIRLRWRRGLRLTMALTGLSIALFGLAQRGLKAPSIFWLAENNGDTFFGAYRYHANAGAFLNLVWPMILLVTVRSFWRPTAHLARAGWCSALFLTLVACGVNVSRGAAGVAVVMLLVASLAMWPLLRRRGTPFTFWKVAVAAMLGLAFFWVLFMHGMGSRSASYWKILGQQLGGGNYQRFVAYGAALRMAPTSGWLGYGAGTFFAVFPDHTTYLNGRLLGFWRFAHEDYLQTVIEYGFLGAALWAAFFFGTIGRALYYACNSKLRTSDRLDYFICVVALMGVALHSLVDFPLQIASIQLYVMMWLALGWALPMAEPGLVRKEAARTSAGAP